MTTLAAAMGSIAAEIDVVLDDLLPAPRGPLTRLAQAMRYCTLGAGKRLRPFLVVATGELFDAPRQALLRAGAAVELIHSYSLIHDDLPSMDDGKLRRGRPTCHLAFDEATAILAGDALQALAFEVLARDDYDLDAASRATLVARLAAAAGISGMCGGQLLDLEAERRQLDIDEIRSMQRMKTGAIIAFAVDAGAAIGGAADTERKALALYAEHIGLAFQIRDDLLDHAGDSALTGKDAGRDAMVGKATFVAHLGVAEAEARLELLKEEAFVALDLINGNVDRLRELFEFVIYRDR